MARSLLLPASGKECRHYAAAIPDGGHENSVPWTGAARVRRSPCPCSFDDRGDLLISTADDDRLTTPRPTKEDQALASAQTAM
ncbi:hypothetical protein ACTJJM_12250 [Stenotrophomonas sp. 22692]|uniref:hypothetical protein n=1 Tax=Stenotrophomonas sp. 22692 TaxID=3453956 RepID=UPI003F84614A